MSGTSVEQKSLQEQIGKISQRCEVLSGANRLGIIGFTTEVINDKATLFKELQSRHSQSPAFADGLALIEEQRREFAKVSLPFVERSVHRGKELLALQASLRDTTRHGGDAQTIAQFETRLNSLERELTKEAAELIKISTRARARLESIETNLEPQDRERVRMAHIRSEDPHRDLRERAMMAGEVGRTGLSFYGPLGAVGSALLSAVDIKLREWTKDRHGQIADSDNTSMVAASFGLATGLFGARGNLVGGVTRKLSGRIGKPLSQMAEALFDAKSLERVKFFNLVDDALDAAHLARGTPARGIAALMKFGDQGVAGVSNASKELIVDGALTPKVVDSLTSALKGIERRQTLLQDFSRQCSQHLFDKAPTNRSGVIALVETADEKVARAAYEKATAMLEGVAYADSALESLREPLLKLLDKTTPPRVRQQIAKELQEQFAHATSALTSRL